MTSAAQQLPTAEAVLELRGVAAAYGRVEVIRDVNLRFLRGSILALLGPNGAGKSTVVKVATGRLRPTRGTVVLDGVDVTKHSPDELARAGVCTLPEGRGVFPNLTVADNLRMWAFRPGVRRSDVEEITYARFPKLGERRRQLAGTLSGGEQQMLALSRALSTKPRVLLLDEMSMGLAPVIVTELFMIVSALRDEGVSVLLVEQFAHAALELADCAAVMVHGLVAYEGPPDDVRAHVEATYLGGGATTQANNNKEKP
ncbi:MAG: ABC transporter ATP-binding protein [Actinomycetes bacterium]